jgi:hypothetical protein
VQAGPAKFAQCDSKISGGWSLKQKFKKMVLKRSIKS